jgi:hypothetical protein
VIAGAVLRIAAPIVLPTLYVANINRGGRGLGRRIRDLLARLRPDF